jgi:hypothetical protein
MRSRNTSCEIGMARNLRHAAASNEQSIPAIARLKTACQYLTVQYRRFAFSRRNDVRLSLTYAASTRFSTCAVLVTALSEEM